MKLSLKIAILLSVFRLCIPAQVYAQGEASTYFNVFVPPNNDPVKRNVCLVVTAIFDDTHFEITDDGSDGDTDDSKSGTLSRGQSYILYIADNGINDDARYASGGTWKQDGDYFIIHSDKNVLVSQSTNSDWQHDFVPSIGQKGIGERFVIYAPQISSSKRDLNTFVYEDSTLVTIKKISVGPTTISGYTNIDYENATVVGTQLLHRGQDIIYFKTLGRDVMETGHTYMVESSKPITLQYGALYGNERDGGGNVPSSNGSSSGELFYFAVPYQSGGEQEIRVVSWDDANSVKLERYNAGAWITVKSWSLNKYGFSDWVGKSNGNVSYPTIFRITGTAGKRVSVFEANWLETGNPGTSDIGSMLSSENGTSAGKKFIAYMAPPGNEQNVRDPFSGNLFGQQLTHLYISTRTGAHVTVKDAFTNGSDFTRNFDIAPERYVDCALTLQEWKNIYNGTGTTSGGPKRPYLVIESDQPVSVFNTNFNDNWMTYLGTSQSQRFSLKTSTPPSAIIPGDHPVIVTQIVSNSPLPIENVTASLQVEGNVRIIASVFSDASGPIQAGQVSSDAQSASFTNLPTLVPANSYSFNTTVVATVANSNGELSIGNSIGTLTSQLTGTADGLSLQAVSSNGLFVNSADQTQLLFSRSTDVTWDNLLTNSWTVNLIDYNNDNWDDIFITDRDKAKPNYLYRNNGNKTFTPITGEGLVKDLAISISSSWADVDNDGDLDVLITNNTEKPNAFYINNGNGTFTKNQSAGFVQQPSYYHNSTWVDYDNDGLLDLFLCNYWPTKLNELWHNDGKGNFSFQDKSLLSQTPGNAASVTWVDYDNDGLMDVFIPDNKGGKNKLFHNEGGGQFTTIDNIISQEGGFSVASCWGDIDGNGYSDLFVSNASARDNFLYLNKGKGIFQKVTTGDVVHNGGHSHGCSFADVDNDGDLDLYVNNDAGDKFLYLNHGNGEFTRKINEVITANYGKALGHAWADLDKDGDLDLFSVTHSNERNHLFWNNGNSNHWIQMKLMGTTSNQSAIGTRIRLKSNNRWQQREINSQSGIGGQSSYRNHFGLGRATQVDSLEIHWPSGMIQVITNVPADQVLMITEETGSKVEGVLFIDTNTNCQKENDEVYLANQAIKISPLNKVSMTDATGKFHAQLAPGNYSIELLQNTHYQLACANAVIDVKVNSNGQRIVLGEIAAKPMCNCADAKINAYTTALRRGFGNDYFVEVSNQGVLPLENVEVKVTAPEKLHFNAAVPSWNSQQKAGSAFEYTWKVGRMKGNELQTIQIRDSVSLGLNVGDEVIIQSEVRHTSAEENVRNNSSTNTYEIVGAIDPNRLIASPRGQGDEHFIANTQEITYHIQFENFGNHTTSFITVSDTLPDLFDLSTLHDIQSSHGPVDTRIEGNQVLFHFRNIHLTPSALDSVKSRGFVEFKIHPHRGVWGTVNNRAQIIFDYNEPIMTNTEMHTYLSKQSVDFGQLLVFPNPATSGKTNLLINPSGENKDVIAEVAFFDLHGSVVKKIESNQSILPVDLADLSNGLYIVQVRSSDSKIYRGKLIVQR